MPGSSQEAALECPWFRQCEGIQKAHRRDRSTVRCLLGQWGNGPYSSPYTIPNNSLHNAFPHSLLSTREINQVQCPVLKVDIVGRHGSFRKLGVAYFGVLIVRILLFRVLYSGLLFSETPTCILKGFGTRPPTINLAPEPHTLNHPLPRPSGSTS